MTETCRMKRKNMELAAFLKSRREQILPKEKGFSRTNKRRAKGLRREELAALADVGLTWYTWLEQGRDITVSSYFLNRLSKILSLEPLEREHLFILAQNRRPEETTETETEVPEIIKHLIKDLEFSPCYVWNLNWDILDWNPAAEYLFRFSTYPKSERNFIWLLFTKPLMKKLITNYESQANDILSSFRRDYALKLKNDQL